MASKPFYPENFPYTFIHDDLQTVIKQLRGASVKVLLYVMRASRVDFTHFVPIGLSINEIMAGSGVAHNSVSPALAQLIDEQIIIREVSGSHQGTLKPLYRYTLNLNYEAIPEIGTAARPKNGTAIPEIGTAARPKNGTAIPEIGTAPTMTGVVESQPVSPSTEQGEGVAIDQRSESDDDLLSSLIEIGQSRSQARQFIAKQGIENAWQWYIYVIDRGDIGNAGGYLYKSAVQRGDPPPEDYSAGDIAKIRERYARRKKVIVEAITTTAEAMTAPAIAPEQNNGLARLWSTVLGELKPQLPGAFDNTLAGSALLSITDGLALVQVPTGAQEVCDRRLRPVVLRSLAAVACDIAIQDVKFQEVA